LKKIDELIAGFVQSVQSVARKETRFSHGPSTLEFAWTSACNLRCVMCGQSDNPPVSKVSLDKAAPFLAKAFDSVVIWNPSATSEPLLNNVDEIVRLCNERGVYLELYTNATLLTPAAFEKIAPRIYKLTLSIDSHVPAVLERVRYPIKAEKVFPNVEYAIRRSNELEIPCVLNAVLMADTLPHFPDFVDWAADRGAKEITILDLLDTSTKALEHDAFEKLGVDKVGELLTATRERARRRNLGLTRLVRPPFGGRDENDVAVPTRVHEAMVIERFQDAHRAAIPGYCSMVVNYLKVLPNGEAFPCCRAPQELRLGNVFEQSLDEVWNGPAAQALRQGMSTGKMPEVCRTCLVRTDPSMAASIQHVDKIEAEGVAPASS
jgi:radical SAM protein with 4Fe4S-binding SPASM domain